MRGTLPASPPKARSPSQVQSDDETSNVGTGKPIVKLMTIGSLLSAPSSPHAAWHNMPGRKPGVGPYKPTVAAEKRPFTASGQLKDKVASAQVSLSSAKSSTFVERAILYRGKNEAPPPLSLDDLNHVGGYSSDEGTAEVRTLSSRTNTMSRYTARPDGVLKALTTKKVPRGIDYVRDYCLTCTSAEIDNCGFCLRSRLSTQHRMSIDRFSSCLMRTDPGLTARALARSVARYARSDRYATECNAQMLGVAKTAELCDVHSAQQSAHAREHTEWAKKVKALEAKMELEASEEREPSFIEGAG